MSPANETRPPVEHDSRRRPFLLLGVAYTWRAAVLLLSALLLASPLQAEDTTPIVTIDAHGWPDAAPTLGRAFYLSGAANDSVDDAYVVFLRRRWAFWGLGKEDPQACERLSAQLKNPADLSKAAPGLSSERKLWPKTAQGGHPALVVKGTTQDDTKDARSYRILVPGSDFFRPGASYCMFVYLHKTVTTTKKVAFKGHLQTFGERRARCKYGASATRDECEQGATNELVTAVAREVSGLEKADVAALEKAIQLRLGAVPSFPAIAEHRQAG